MAKKLIGYKLNGSISMVITIYKCTKCPFFSIISVEEKTGMCSCYFKIFKYSLKDIQDFCQLDNVDGDDLNERYL